MIFWLTLIWPFGDLHFLFYKLQVFAVRYLHKSYSSLFRWIIDRKRNYYALIYWNNHNCLFYVKLSHNLRMDVLVAVVGPRSSIPLGTTTIFKKNTCQNINYSRAVKHYSRAFAYFGSLSSSKNYLKNIW